MKIVGGAQDYLPKAVPERVQRFDYNDPLAYKYLEDNGYLVLKNVANEQEISKGISLAWDFVEHTVPGVKRSDVSTYNNHDWPGDDAGILTENGIGHSELLWFVRGLNSVQTIFKTLWNTDHVITSYDGCNIMRPWEYNSNWKTSPGGWYHVDQNPLYKPGKMCIQGFLNFFPSGETDGGLVVVPKSHLAYNEITAENAPYLKDCGNMDFVLLNDMKIFWNSVGKAHAMRAIKVCLEPGDFVLWDSRTIHCNACATSARPIPKNGEILSLRRLVTYVCMVPRDRLPKELEQQRIKAYEEGHTTTHWPEKCQVLGRENTSKAYVPVQLSAQQKQLIPM